MESKYSQHDEEAHILSWFGHDGKNDSSLRSGCFLDIGAYTGVELSNTRRLAELGWGGVAVEAAAAPFASLLKNYREYPTVALVCAAIWKEPVPGLVEFQQTDGDAVACLASCDEHIKIWKDAVQFQRSFVSAIPISVLLSRFSPPYDFVSLDIEGANWEILQTLPVESMGTSLLCVEVDERRKDMVAWASDHGFDLVVYESYENLIVGKA